MHWDASIPILSKRNKVENKITQGTSDFPVALKNIYNKLIVK
jgi:hypothetical protein